MGFAPRVGTTLENIKIDKMEQELKDKGKLIEEQSKLLVREVSSVRHLVEQVRLLKRELSDTNSKNKELEYQIEASKAIFPVFMLMFSAGVAMVTFIISAGSFCK